VATIPEKIAKLKLLVDTALGAGAGEGELARINREREFLEKVRKGRGSSAVAGTVSDFYGGIIVNEVDDFLA